MAASGHKSPRSTQWAIQKYGQLSDGKVVLSTESQLRGGYILDKMVHNACRIEAAIIDNFNIKCKDIFEKHLL